MAAVLRKRKIIDTGFGDAPTLITPASQRQPRIQQFARLSKPGVRRADKEIKTTPVVTAAAAANPTGTESKKRKLLDHHDPLPPLQSSTSPQSRQARPVTPPPASSKTTTIETATTSSTNAAQRKARLPPSQPGEPRRIAPVKRLGARATGATVAESPTQGARAILEAFVLAAPAPTTPAEQAAQQADDNNDKQREHIALYAAFLSALSLHYAHEGTSTPADLRQLSASITRIWGRRRVTADDIRRVLGVQQWNGATSSSSSRERKDLPTLIVSDLGQGRICIEFEPSETTATFSQISSPLPVATLKRIFAGNLLALGDQELPLAPVTPYTPVSITSTTTGAARLADLKASALNAQANTARFEGLGIKAAAASSSSPSLLSSITKSSSVTAKPASRGASLLARICAKEAHAAQQPAAPSAAAVARKAALQRLEEIIPVIEQLASRSRGSSNGSSISTARSQGSGAGASSASADLAASLGLASSSGGCRTNGAGATVSFTLPALVQQLQNSLRHPLGKEEGELCIRLLAAELLPRWIQVHALGSGGQWTSVSVRGSVRRGEWVDGLRDLLNQD